MTASTSSSQRASADRNRFIPSPPPSAQERIAIIRLSYSSSLVAYSITLSRTTSENISLSRDSFRREDCAQLSSDVNWISEGSRQSTSRRLKMILNRHTTSKFMPSQSPTMMVEDEVEDRQMMKGHQVTQRTAKAKQQSHRRSPRKTIGSKNKADDRSQSAQPKTS
jgi:hypothetical protein